MREEDGGGRRECVVTVKPRRHCWPPGDSTVLWKHKQTGLPPSAPSTFSPPFLPSLSLPESFRPNTSKLKDIISFILLFRASRDFFFFFFSKALNGIFNTWATFTTWYYITIRHSQVHSMLACFMIHHVNVGGCRWWNGWVQLAENSRPWDNSLRGICLCISFRPEDDDRVY